MKQNKIRPDDISEKIAGTFNNINKQRIEGLEKLKTIQDIKAKLQIKEKERLSKKYGTDHPRVLKISSQLVHDEKFIKALDIEIERLKIEVPDVDENSWMLHGRILTDDYRGIPNLTIFLSDKYEKEDLWLRELGYTCSNELGYFSIIYPPTGTKSKIPADQNLFLRVSDKDHKIIYNETEPVYIKPGKVDYKTIFISSQNNACTPPEPQTGPVPKPEPEQDSADTQLPPDVWVVHGIVTDGKNNGIKGLIISLYDKDLLFDDNLGTTITDDKGKFQIIYRTESFRGLFEKNPDIYLKVLDKQGKVLYSSKEKVRPRAGHNENFKIKIIGNIKK